MISLMTWHYITYINNSHAYLYLNAYSDLKMAEKGGRGIFNINSLQMKLTALGSKCYMVSLFNMI